MSISTEKILDKILYLLLKTHSANQIKTSFLTVTMSTYEKPTATIIP